LELCFPFGIYPASTGGDERVSKSALRIHISAEKAKVKGMSQLGGWSAMVKETKFLRRQAEKARRMARATSDSEKSENLSNLAKAYRSQAEVLKMAKKKFGKKQR
jgi:hypothetical protein